jgi:hypothetical protein
MEPARGALSGCTYLKTQDRSLQLSDSHGNDAGLGPSPSSVVLRPVSDMRVSLHRPGDPVWSDVLDWTLRLAARVARRVASAPKPARGGYHRAARGSTDGGRQAAGRSNSTSTTAAWQQRESGLVALALLMRFRGCLIGLCLGNRGCLVDRGDVRLGQRLDTPRSPIVDALDIGRVYD